jgi:hypothetical protein
MTHDGSRDTPAPEEPQLSAEPGTEGPAEPGAEGSGLPPEQSHD